MKNMLDLLELFPLRFPLLIPVLNAIGYSLKHKSSLPNELIPPILFATSLGVNIVLRYLTSPYSGLYYWFDIVFFYAIVNSFKCFLYAIGGYEAVRAIRFSCKRQGVKDFMKRPFVRLFLAFIASCVLFTVLGLVFGFSILDIFFKITDGWIFGVLFLTAFDLFSKIAKHKDRITPVYITMLVLILLNVAMFFTASVTTDVKVCYATLALALLFGLSAGICSFVPFVREKKQAKKEKLENLTEEDLQKIWIKIRAKLVNVSDEKKLEILKGFLAYKPYADNINNALDFSQPMILVKNPEGETKATSISGAISLGVAEAELTTHVAYLKQLIGIKEDK